MGRERWDNHMLRAISPTIMGIKFWKTVSNPLFTFLLCVIALINFFGDSLFLLLVFTILPTFSFIISIIKSDKFSIKPLAISSTIIIFISSLSFISILMGYLALAVLFILWIVCIIFSIISIIFSIKNNKNHILNYVFLFSLLASLIGSTFVNIKINYHEKNLLEIAYKIENYYTNTNKTYNYGEIYKILDGNKKLSFYDIDVEDSFYTINISLSFAGGLRSMMYDSRDKNINKAYMR
jgi:hypothetical protein